MSCNQPATRFRLLDVWVGWDAEHSDGLEGLDDPRGVRLAVAAEDMHRAPLAAIGTRIPNARLAAGCDPCTWTLATPSPPGPRLLRLDGCDNSWRPVPADECAPGTPIEVVAIAYTPRVVALADRGAGRVWVLSEDGARIVGEAQVAEPRALTWSPSGALLVASNGHDRLLSFDQSGAARGAFGPPLPAGEVDRLAFDLDGRLWVVIACGDGRGELWLLDDPGVPYRPSTLAELFESFATNTLAHEAPEGFCLTRGSASAEAVELCYSWYGRPLSLDCLGAAGEVARATRGQLLTAALDSGIPRCRWHRIRIDADIPSGTGVELSVASSESPTPPAQGLALPPWETFPPGVPHPEDWHALPPRATDALIDQPAGRYLFVRLRLVGDGRATPVVRRVHIDFPRNTSADLLPTVYREEPDSADFTERFVSLFDAALAEASTAVEKFPALLDPEGVPNEVLPWIGQLLGLVFDPGWEPDRQRKLLAAAPSLFRRRGTPAGMAQAIRLVFGAEAAIEELGALRAWGAIPMPGEAHPSGVRLRRTRLFGRGRARLTLGRSELGQSRIRSFGDPANDPHAAGAFRFRVAVPPGDGRRVDRLRRLVDGQKPAHTLAEVRVGGQSGFTLAPGAQIGVDTVFGSPPPVVLRDARLSREAVLRSRGSNAGLRLEGGTA